MKQQNIEIRKIHRTSFFTGKPKAWTCWKVRGEPKLIEQRRGWKMVVFEVAGEKFCASLDDWKNRARGYIFVI
jgi:hypothetical protein